jgi:two-component system OmpR family sensor kinase
MVTPILVMVPLLMLVVWWVVSVSLAPIARVRQQVATRQIDDLHAVSEVGLPDELRPVVRELNLLFKRIHDAFETQTTFVADAAHELRSPLAALKLQVEGLRRAQDEHARDKAVVRLNAGIDRATRLVEQLLALARQQAMKTTPVKNETVDLVSAVRTVVADMALTAQLRNIHVNISAPQPCLVSGQTDALQMLVRNLLDNAIKYTPEGGQVAMALHPSDEQILLTVEDSGRGIAAQDRERVFDRFYRATGTEVSGSGLGLAIVKTIAEIHGARLTLDQSPGLGGLRVSLTFHRLTNAALNETR